MFLGCLVMQWEKEGENHPHSPMRVTVRAVCVIPASELDAHWLAANLEDLADH